jgi:TolA-binding protein
MRKGRSSRRRKALGALTLAALFGLSGPALALEEADRLWLVGEQAFQDKLYTVAGRTLARLIERYPQDRRAPEATLLLGKARLSHGALGPALDAFRRAQAFVPPPGKPEEARFWEAETLSRMKRHAEARAVYDRLVAENAASPFAADALYGLGWTELELKRPQAAAGAFRQLIDAFPDHASVPSATVTLGRLLIEAKQHADAVGVLQRFPERFADHRVLPEARYLLGLARLGAGQTAEGVQELRAFLAASPRHELAGQARRLVVDGLLREGSREELAEQYRALMAVTPATAEILYDAGLVAARIGQRPDAEAAWTRLRRGFPDHPLTVRASLDLALAAFDRGDFPEAVPLARKATASPDLPVRAQAWLILGESELKLRRFGPAHDAFQAAAAAAGEDAAVRYRALAGSGLALEEQRQWGPALRYYEEVAEKSPDTTLQAWAATRRDEVAERLNPPPVKGPSRSILPEGSKAPNSTAPKEKGKP